MVFFFTLDQKENMDKAQLFNKICKDIKSVRIQGASNIAKSALKAYYLFPERKNIILNLRPTEPMLRKVLELAENNKKREIVEHFKNTQNKINNNLFKIIKNNNVIFTHCHSANVIKALIYAKNNKKKFEVYNTETRPLFQGRKTSQELSKARIKVTMFADSAMKIAITRPVDLVLLGADAITKKGVINKIGSGLIAEIAYRNKIPVYIVSDSWKYTESNIKLEQRDTKEIWNNRKINIKNPAFEFVPKKYIKGIISELGILKFNQFIIKA